MASIRSITDIITEQVKEFAAYPEEWLRFLMAPCNQNYKLRFDEKVMLYHENPDASMVATMNAWNKINYRIRRGSKGIPVLSGEPGVDGKLKYYFSIADTVNLGKYRVEPWKIQDDEGQAITALFDFKGDMTDVEAAIRQDIRDTITEEAESYIDDLCKTEGFSDLDIEKQNTMIDSFREIVIESTVLLIMNRLGVNPKSLDVKKFDSLRLFSEFDLFSSIAAMTNDITVEKLDLIKQNIKEYRRKNDLTVSVSRESSIPSNREQDRRSGVRDVRESSQDLFREESPVKVPADDGERESGAALPAGGSTGESDGTRSDEEAGGTGRDQRGTKRGGSDGLGEGNEYVEKNSGGNSEESAGISVEKAESHETPAFSVSGTVIPDSVVDAVLRTGGGNRSTLEHIALWLRGFRNVDSFTDLLRNEYQEGGKGFNIDGRNICVWYDTDGIRFSTGSSTKAVPDRILDWKEAAARIHDMYLSGNYTDNDMLSDAYDNQIEETASDLYYAVKEGIADNKELWDSVVPEQLRKSLYKDTNVGKGISDNEGFSGYPDFVSLAKEDLQDPEKRELIRAAMQAFYGEYKESEDARSYLVYIVDHLHKAIEGINYINDAQEPVRQSSDGNELQEIAFVTEDEVLEVLKTGSHFAGGKIRLYEYLHGDHSEKEKIDYVKKEYGTGGFSGAIKGCWSSNADYDAKGIRITKGKYPSSSAYGEDGVQINLNWKTVTNLISGLIQRDQYLSDREKKIYSKKVEEKKDCTYRCNEGDIVYIDSKKYIFLTYKGDTVCLQDAEYPLFKTILKKDEFIKKIRTNPLNDHLIVRGQEPGLNQTNMEEEHQVHGDAMDAPEVREEADASTETGNEDPEPVSEDKDSLQGEVVTIDRMEYEVVEDNGAEAVLKNLADDKEESEHLPRTESTEAVRDYIEGLASDESVPEEPETQIIQSTQPQELAVQYRIKEDTLGAGGPKAKFHRNIEAIRILKRCENEGRMATVEEQESLAQYVGWGGLSAAFDPNDEKWTKEYAELKDLLTEDEYVSARKSTMTAFYTPPAVIRSIYHAISKMGFKTGNILEPSCGTGNFIGMQPDDISEGCNTYGIELDSISGRIAQQLYQKSRIQVCGYEASNLPDNFFDVAVGNVPFGEHKVYDKKYNKQPWLIHDYFIGKTLDKVRPGGVIAFITSKGTMDKKNPKVRQYFAERAELLGAIRLPDDTFKVNAGKDDITTDILFLKKKEHPDLGREADWVHLGTDPNGIEMNQYFVDHPEMIMGHMEMVNTNHGMESTCRPYIGTDISAELENAIDHIDGSIDPYIIDDMAEDSDERIPADPNVRNFSYALIDGKLYYREDSVMYPPKKGRVAAERIQGMIELRDSVRELIRMQMEEYSDQDIRGAQRSLEQKYDSFVHRFDRINSKANRLAFQDDESYYLLSSLEMLNDDGSFNRKADIFSKRTITQHVPVTRTDTASEALMVSLSEKAAVDLDYMSDLCGMSADQIKEELSGVIFRNIVPGDGASYVTSEEYLSGNVRQKLLYAKEAAERGEPDAEMNVKALERVQPEDLTPADINVRLGSTWIPAKDIEDFVKDLLELGWSDRRRLHVLYNKFSGEWTIPNKSGIAAGDIRKNVTYGTARADALHIIEATLNLRTMRITDTIEVDGKQRSVVNKKETEAAIAKQELIMSAFKDWIWKDPYRRERLCREYNERYNSTRLRTYDGSFLQFSGINPTITLKEHQKNAVARVMLGGNTLIAHCVGAGKTYEMAASAQEMKRLGLCQKSLFVVPNHLTEQWGSEYLSLYPGANILVATKRDFEKSRRKKFCGRIATGDYDAVIIGHSQFEKIPMNKDYRKKILEEERDEIIKGIEDARNDYETRGITVKQMERLKASIEVKLEKLNDEDRKDDVVTFDQLGIDRLFVDEAHYYKNLAAFTKMTNVAGIAQTEAQKSSDMYMKCRYMNEKTGGKGVIFATGTPISNSMVEMYTMQKYLQYDDLKEKELLHFDAWASTFGETKTEYELKPEGTGYQVKTRFSRFFNIPELTTMFAQVADIKTADMLDLDVPECERHVVSIEASDVQKELVQELSHRADVVRKGSVDPSVDNMLKITNDGRKLALDQKLISSDMPDNPESKSAVCADKVYEIWDETKDSRSTQMIFCDLSTPDKDKWNVYYELRARLMERGIPDDEIAFVHSAKTDKQKDALFKKVREGQVRIIIGSTVKMGAGTNVQDQLIALHHLDCPWRPADLQQQEGRILRQGNRNKKVHIYNYVTKGTFDAYMYQLVENKQKFISQIMTSKSPARVVEDVDAIALNYAEIKACCADDPLIRDKMSLENNIQKLRLLRSSYYSAKYSLEDSINKKYPERIASEKELIKKLKADALTVEVNTNCSEGRISPMIINGAAYTDQKEAGKALLEASVLKVGMDNKVIGSFRGLKMKIERSYSDAFDDTLTLYLCGAKEHRLKISRKQATRNISKINELLNNIPLELTNAEKQLLNYREQLETAKQEVQKPFEKEEELQQSEKRLEEINKALEERDTPIIPEAQEEDGELDDSSKGKKVAKKYA